MDKGKIYQCTFFIIGIALVLAVCWYLLTDIPNNGGRTDSITKSLDRIGNEQRNTKEHLERIERGLDESIRSTDEIAKRIDDAQSAINASQERRGECEEILRDSESRIAESRAIIQGIRKSAGQNGK